MDCKKTWRALGTDGYPIIVIDGKNVRFSRYFYEQCHEVKLEDGEIILHTCDHPWCVEITHLVKGTQLDNIADMVSKGRQAKGTAKANSKLTDEDIPIIRDLYEWEGWSQRQIAKRFGVNQSIISDIVTGKIWKHV